MKRLIFLALLLAHSALAQSLNIGTATFGAPACSKGDTTNTWDIFIEGFTSGSDTNWSKVGAGADTNLVFGTDSAALTTAKPPGVCDTSAFINHTNADGVEIYARVQLTEEGTNNTTTTLTLALYIDQGPDTAGENYKIFGWRDNNSFSALSSLALWNNAGTLQIKAEGAVDSEFISVAEDQWYTLVVTLDATAGADGSSLTIYSGGSQIGTDLFSRTAEDGCSWLFFGLPQGLDAVDEARIYYDLIQVEVTP